MLQGTVLAKLSQSSKSRDYVGELEPLTFIRLTVIIGGIALSEVHFISVMTDRKIGIVSIN